MTQKRDYAMLENRRLQGVMLLANGLSQSEVARQLGVTRQAVACWKQRLAEGGPDSLMHHQMGPLRRLSSRQEKLLEQILMAGALAAGYSTNRWTLRRIGKVILDTFGVEYSTGHVWHVLDRMGFSRQKLKICTTPHEGTKTVRGSPIFWTTLDKGPAGNVEPEPLSRSSH